MCVDPQLLRGRVGVSNTGVWRALGFDRNFLKGFLMKSFVLLSSETSFVESRFFVKTLDARPAR